MTKIFYILALLCVLVGIARAADPPTKDAEGFEPVNGSMMMKTGESIPASRLVATAYGFILASVVVYVVSVAVRARRLESELDELKRKLDQGR